VPSSASCSRRRCCPGGEGTREELFPTSSHKVCSPELNEKVQELGDWVNEGVLQHTNGSASSSKCVPKPDRNGSTSSLSERHRLLLRALESCPDPQERMVEPKHTLDAIIAIEGVCRGDLENWDNDSGAAKLEVMIDQPGARYVVCNDPATPLATGFFWTELANITVDEAVHALADKEQRHCWDAAAEFNVLQGKQEDDPVSSEITFHLLRAPWPFWDRDVLQRRSRLTLPLCESDSRLGHGMAFVAQSVEDSSVLACSEHRIRATVHMAGHLLRPLSAKKSAHGLEGIEVTVCQRVDIGGVAPPWAQSLIARFAAKQSLKWADRLREHCLSMRREDNGNRMPLGVAVCLPPLDRELSERELMGQ